MPTIEPTDANRQLAELLRGIDPQALGTWGVIVRLLLEHKQQCGLADWSDDRVIANAPRVFHALVSIVVEASRTPALAHRLEGLQWFTAACAALIEGAALPRPDA